MSNATLPRRPVPERTTTTILRQRHTATAVAGGSAQSALVGPAAGKKWLIVNAVVTVQYAGDPGTSESGDALGEVLNGGLAITFVGGTAYQDMEESLQFGQAAPDMVLEFGDEVRLSVGAQNSAFDVDGILTFWGFEYDDV